jgi:hypothetical protein
MNDKLLKALTDDPDWPILSIRDTIQSAIDRAGEATLEVDGVDIETIEFHARWRRYAAEMHNMAWEWEDRYPLARELSKLDGTGLGLVWNGLIG